MAVHTAFLSNLVQGDTLTLKAGADFSAKQYHIAKFSTTAGEAALATAVGDGPPFLVILDKPASGEPCDLAISGVVPVKLGGTVAVGDKITTDANSQGIKTTTATEPILGIVLKAGVANDLVAVRVTQGAVKAAS